MVRRRGLRLKRRHGDSILRFDGECGFFGCNPWWFRFHLFTVCGCSIVLTSVLSQWYSTYGWMNIQDVISGWVGGLVETPSNRLGDVGNMPFTTI